MTSAIHKITPSNPRIAALLGEVAKGNIKIPVFQRQYVWSDEQIMSLLDSIYRGFPVGSLLLWSTKEALNHERNVGGFKRRMARTCPGEVCVRSTSLPSGSQRNVSCMSRAGWSAGMLSAAKLYSSVSISGPSRTWKPMA